MIPLFKVYMSPLVGEEVTKTLYSGTITQGPKVEEYEAALRAYLGLKHVVTVNSGTSALELALELAGVNAGDYVISTPMTCSATNTAIRARQAHIVWADIDSRTGNVTKDTVARAISNIPYGATAKAVMMVHWGGLPCDVVGINLVAQKYGLKTIEDAAHAFGSKVDNRPVGLYSDFTAFSTQAIKHLTTVDGGILITKSEQDYKDAKLLRWFGIDREGPKTSFRCELDLGRPGHKFHMNDVNATIGIENLKHMDAVIGQHRSNTYQMDKLLHHSPLGLTHRPWSYDSSCWLYTVRLPSRYLRDKFELYMTQRGVQCSQVHAPNHKHTFTKAYGPTHLPGVEEFSSTQTNIPIGWWVTPDDVRYIASCALDFCKLYINEDTYE